MIYWSLPGTAIPHARLKYTTVTFNCCYWLIWNYLLYLIRKFKALGAARGFIWRNFYCISIKQHNANWRVPNETLLHCDLWMCWHIFCCEVMAPGPGAIAEFWAEPGIFPSIGSIQNKWLFLNNKQVDKISKWGSLRGLFWMKPSCYDWCYDMLHKQSSLSLSIYSIDNGVVWTVENWFWARNKWFHHYG